MMMMMMMMMTYCNLTVFQIRKMRAAGMDKKTVVVVGTVTDDKRIFEIPALKVLHLTISPIMCV